MEKLSGVGSAATDRKWQKLTFSGTLIADPKDNSVYLKVHRGLPQAALASLRAEGIDCESLLDKPEPHIAVFRNPEVKILKERFGNDWVSRVGDGKVFRYTVVKLVNLIPHSESKWSRVWFIECDSPELEALRKNLGFSALPASAAGHTQRFHITFAGRVSSKHEVKKALQLLDNTDLKESFELSILETTSKTANRAEGGPALLAQASSLPTNSDTQSDQLKAVFEKMEFDPDVTERTLKKRFGRGGVDLLLNTTSKLVRVSRGEDTTDDRDSLAFQRVLGPEDLFAERVIADAGQIGRKMLYKATLNGKLDHVPNGALTPQVSSALLASGLGQALEGISAVEYHDQKYKISRMGEGGIQDTSAIPEECYDILTQVLTRRGWLFWPDVLESDEFACLINGRKEFYRAKRLIRQKYCGTMYGIKTKSIDLLVTTNHRIWAKKHINNLPKFDWEFETAKLSYKKQILLLSDVEDVFEEVGCEDWYELDGWSGEVFCAEVPGELLLVRRNESVPVWCGNSRAVQPTHLGFIDVVKAPESATIGTDMRAAHGVKRGSDGRLYTQMINARTGKLEVVDVTKASSSVVGFSGEQKRLKENGFVRALVSGGKVDFVSPDKVDYYLPHASRTYTDSSNLVPMISAMKPGRMIMGARMSAQALPLANAEAQLVRSVREDGTSFATRIGQAAGAIRSDAHAIVKSAEPGKIVIQQQDGEERTIYLHDHTPGPRKSYFHQEPAVKTGDLVKPGDLLAYSNFTDKKGDLAFGVNLRTAYVVADEAGNFEDALTISESAAKRLGSLNMYQYTKDRQEGIDIDKNSFISSFTAKYTADQLKTIDKNGIIKPGIVVKQGDPLVLAVSRTDHARADKLGRRRDFTDASITWEHPYEGTVSDVAITKDGSARVSVKAVAPFMEADKLSGLFGDKGVVSKIVPDRLMPHDEQGRPIELLFNPLGLVTRGNSAQVYEALLGKIAQKTGKRYDLPGFIVDGDIEEGTWDEYVDNELKKHGIKATEDLIDPTTGKKIPAVLTGVRYFMKLHHMAADKEDERDEGEGYTSEETPASGSKRFGQLQLLAILSHDAPAVVRDFRAIKGQKNTDYWRELKLGRTPPPPKEPFTHVKFLDSLRSAGIKVDRDNTGFNLYALTDKDVLSMSRGKIINAETVDPEKMREIKGGLFDKDITGGHGGERFAHIELPVALPNPAFEDVLLKVTGLTEKRLNSVIAGEEQIEGKTGPEAIRSLLNFDVEQRIKQTEDIIRTGSKTRRDAATRVLPYLRAMAKNNFDPKDLLIQNVPVIPPRMRPISAQGGRRLVADVNYLYRDLIASAKDYSDLVSEVGEKNAGAERINLYNAFKAVVGTGDPVNPKTKEKQVKGIVGQVFGVGSPKYGMLQHRVFDTSVDLSGRGVVLPDSSLTMDEIGLPKNMARSIFRPFVMSRLVRSGMRASDAARAVIDWTEPANKALEAEMAVRPVMMNRAPTLHAYGFMGHMARITPGHSIRIPPSVVVGYNADFDGDAVSIHVPVSEEAVQQVKDKMLSSRNIRSARNFKIQHMPKNEFALGIWIAGTSKSKNPVRKFANRDEVLKAIKKGEIDVDDQVEISSSA